MTVPEGARPPLDRKRTRKSEENRDSALDEGIKITVAGEVFEARYGDITPEIARELRANCGMSFIRLVNSAKADPDIDVLGPIVWVARRIRGELVAFNDVNVTYTQMLADDFDMDDPAAEELNDRDPEG